MRVVHFISVVHCTGRAMMLRLEVVALELHYSRQLSMNRGRCRAQLRSMWRRKQLLKVLSEIGTWSAAGPCARTWLSQHQRSTASGSHHSPKLVKMTFRCLDSDRAFSTGVNSETSCSRSMQSSARLLSFCNIICQQQYISPST